MSYENPTDNRTSTRTASTTAPDIANKKAFFRKRKGCPLSLPGAPEIDYKNPKMLKKFTSEGGRMLPRRITYVSAKKQRKLKNAIKIARILALLPFVFQAK